MNVFGKGWKSLVPQDKCHSGTASVVIYRILLSSRTQYL
jgi:hypothetical protein